MLDILIATEKKPTKEKNLSLRRESEKRALLNGTFNGEMILIQSERRRSSTAVAGARENGMTLTMERWSSELCALLLDE